MKNLPPGFSRVPLSNSRGAGRKVTALGSGLMFPTSHRLKAAPFFPPRFIKWNAKEFWTVIISSLIAKLFTDMFR